MFVNEFADEYFEEYVSLGGKKNRTNMIKMLRYFLKKHMIFTLMEIQ